MALTKETEITKIEVVGEHKTISVRTDTIIKEDGKELSRSVHRHSLVIGTLDKDDNLVETDISAEDKSVKDMCELVWTDEVKTAWKNKLIENKSKVQGVLVEEER
tara:strand:+ start:619 stop:933 length:315 start_codon:yes stop_codon:yes gene_type:complete